MHRHRRATAARSRVAHQTSTELSLRQRLAGTPQGDSESPGAGQPDRIRVVDFGHIDDLVLEPRVQMLEQSQPDADAVHEILAAVVHRAEVLAADLDVVEVVSL